MIGPDGEPWTLAAFTEGAETTTVWSMIDSSDLWDTLDLVPSHYHPRKLQFLDRLEAKSQETISDYFYSVRELVTPSDTTLPPVDSRVYDLTDALGNFLKEGSPIDSVEDIGSTKKLARPGDVIISRLRSYLREIAVIPDSAHAFLLSSEFIVLRGRERLGNTTGEFLLPYLLSEPIQTILKWSQQGSNHPRFSESLLLNLPLPQDLLTSTERLNSQVLSARTAFDRSKVLYAEAETLLLDALGLDAVLDTEDEAPLTYTQSSSRAWSAGRLDAGYFQPTYTRIEQAIQQQQHARLGKLIEPLINGYDYRDYVDEGTPYIRVGDVNQGRLDLEGAAKVGITIDDVDKNVDLRVGDVLFTRKGTFGNAAVVREGQTHAIISSEIMRLRLNDPRIQPDYLALFLNSDAGYLQVERRVHGVAYYSISQPDLESIFIPILPDDLQQQLTCLVQQSIEAEQESHRLLEEAQQKVTNLILE